MTGVNVAPGRPARRGLRASAWPGLLRPAPPPPCAPADAPQAGRAGPRRGRQATMPQGRPRTRGGPRGAGGGDHPLAGPRRPCWPAWRRGRCPALWAPTGPGPVRCARIEAIAVVDGDAARHPGRRGRAGAGHRWPPRRIAPEAIRAQVTELAARIHRGSGCPDGAAGVRRRGRRPARRPGRRRADPGRRPPGPRPGRAAASLAASAREHAAMRLRVAAGRARVRTACGSSSRSPCTDGRAAAWTAATWPPTTARPGSWSCWPSAAVRRRVLVAAPDRRPRESPRILTGLGALPGSGAAGWRAGDRGAAARRASPAWGCSPLAAGLAPRPDQPGRRRWRPSSAEPRPPLITTEEPAAGPPALGRPPPGCSPPSACPPAACAATWPCSAAPRTATSPSKPPPRSPGC